MSVQILKSTNQVIADLLDEARQEPVILKTTGNGDFAVLPLDDDLIDLLLSRNPRLIEECRGIEERMKEGKYLTHEQVLTALGTETGS